jgi:hypothetical protein
MTSFESLKSKRGPLARQEEPGDVLTPNRSRAADCVNRIGDAGGLSSSANRSEGPPVGRL